jgi:hypothetical protein
VVAVLQGAQVEVWYCDFSKNSAQTGAALAARDPGTSVELHFTTLWQNVAAGEPVRLVRGLRLFKSLCTCSSAMVNEG